MAIILLDEEFYKNYFVKENKEYLKLILKFIKNHMSLDIAIFLPDSNMSSIWSSSNISSQVNREIQSTGKYKIVNSNDVNLCNIDLSSYGLSKEFTNKISYLHNNESEIIIPFAKEKHYKDIKKIEDYIYVINEVETELNSNFAYFISNEYLRIMFPQKTEPLPNKAICCKFKQYQDDMVKGKTLSERHAIYYEIAREVLKRNGYKENQHISSLNRGVFGGVFSYDDATTLIYASADIEHGAIEIFSKEGKHQDEYTYDGVARGKCDLKGQHDIKV